MGTKQIEKEFTRVLERPERDLEGRMLPAGTRVLFNPAAPSEFFKDTPQNRRRFLELGLAWTQETWERVWFLPPSEFSEAALRHLEAIRSARQAFVAALDENLRSLLGRPFPQVRGHPARNLLPLETGIRIRAVEKVADLSEHFCRALRDLSDTPRNRQWPPEYIELARSLNEMSVYCLRGWGKELHVVVTFASIVQPEKKAEPRWDGLGPAAADALREVYERWRAGERHRKPACVVFAVASLEKPRCEGLCSAGGKQWWVLSYRGDGGRWESLMPRAYGESAAFAGLLEVLRPETFRERVARVKRLVDEAAAEGGNVTVERIAERVGYRPETVREAFLALQDSNTSPYRLYRTSGGRVAIRLADPGEKVRLTAASFRPGFLARHALQLCGTAVGVGAWALRDALRISGVVGFAAFVGLVYATSCVQRVLNDRLAEPKE